MSEENSEIQNEPNPAVESAPQAPLSESDKEALELGWRPKEDFLGKDEDFVDSATFIKTKPLIDKLSGLKKVLKDQQRAIDHLVVHNKQVEELTIKSTIEKLKRDQNRAAIEGNTTAVAQYTDEIIKLQAPVQPSPQGQQAETQNFVARNSSWFNTETEENARMRDYAILEDTALLRTNPSLSISERYAKVEAKIQKEFPKRFPSMNRHQVAAVLPGSGPSPGRKGDGFADLDSFHKNIVRRIQRTNPNFDVKTYIDQVKQIEGR